MAKTVRKKTKTKKATTDYTDVPAHPVKSFFVNMLTRDISLADAILDLLDNCVDGILRKNRGRTTGPRPYQGFHADITYNGDEFEISDNCGGIPWSLHQYAFRMGRADSDRNTNMPTVGVYGIGMKRAIFKIGKQCLIQTQNGDNAYDVEITPEWLTDERNWDMPVSESGSRRREDGTTIVISGLSEGVRSLFHDDFASFEKDFRQKVATHYAFIINKGFRIRVNGKPVVAKPTELRFDAGTKKNAIRPFIYTTTIDDVDVFLAVGFTNPIPSEDDVLAEQLRKQYSSLDAGWTIVCNDRAVVYCDRTELTGWGEAGVPQFHTQFIAIAGVVEFRSNDASKLPTTTTKRGIDASSRLYLQIKNKMREGLQMFTDFTNKWKGRELAREAQNIIRRAAPTTLAGLRAASAKLSFRTLSSGPKGRQYKPKLPMPRRRGDDNQRITFVRGIPAVEEVALLLFNRKNVNPSKVGEACFDRTLDEARE